LHFAPTEKSRDNLIAENVPIGHITVTGNTVVDSLYEVIEKLNTDVALSAQLARQMGLDPDKRLVLVTVHRRESFGEGIDRICMALARLSARSDVQIVYPVHLNPNVKGPVEEKLGNLANVRLIAPQDYLPFVYLMSRADIILTDSGGVQEEAPSLGKPVLVLREFTERPEAVDAGTVRLVGTDADRIVAEVTELLDNEAAYKEMSFVHNPYGDGKSTLRIIDAIRKWQIEHHVR
jgi:UDP-N-acetylglucosamine 2-epimerase (non-hydrolysing)